MNKKQKGRKRQPLISDDEYEDTASELESDEDYISDADTDDSLEVAAALRKTIFADDGDENVYQVKKENLYSGSYWKHKWNRNECVTGCITGNGCCQI